jgi:hypothetical protein
MGMNWGVGGEEEHIGFILITFGFISIFGLVVEYASIIHPEENFVKICALPFLIIQILFILIIRKICVDPWLRKQVLYASLKGMLHPVGLFMGIPVGLVFGFILGAIFGHNSLIGFYVFSYIGIFLGWFIISIIGFAGQNISYEDYVKRAKKQKIIGDFSKSNLIQIFIAVSLLWIIVISIINWPNPKDSISDISNGLILSTIPTTTSLQNLDNYLLTHQRIFVSEVFDLDEGLIIIFQDIESGYFLCNIDGKYLILSGDDINNRSCQFQIRKKGDNIGFKSSVLGENMLQAVPPGWHEDQLIVRFYSSTFDLWEYFTIEGTLDQAIIKSSYTNKYLHLSDEGKIILSDESTPLKILVYGPNNIYKPKKTQTTTSTIETTTTTQEEYHL